MIFKTKVFLVVIIALIFEVYSYPQISLAQSEYFFAQTSSEKITKVSPEFRSPEPEKLIVTEEKGKKRWLWWVIGGVIVGGIGAAALAGGGSGGGSSEPKQPASISASW
ncbi:MAG: hypothetical protein HQK76_18975 [Desulfobacterales bacterium]|nr:hypothetical protein [Desulfobacterales bacterium]